MPTTPPATTPMPPAPDPDNRSTFDTLAYPWAAAQETLRTEMDALAENVYDNAVEAEADAVAAAASEANAAASAAAAAAAAAAAPFISDHPYSQYEAAISGINYQTYRRLSAGSGTDDPAIDPDNWRPLLADLTEVPVTATGTCVPFTREMCAASAAITRTIPAGLGVGARVGWKSNGQDFGMYSVTIVPPSGHKIEDQAIDETLLVDVPLYVPFELRQTSAGVWRIY